MRTELFDQFKNACNKARVISELPHLSEEQYAKIFQHVSNSAIEATVNTINFAYQQILKECAD